MLSLCTVSLHWVGNCGLLGLHQSKGYSPSSVQSWLFFISASKQLSIMTTEILINNQLSSPSSSSSSPILSSDLSKSSVVSSWTRLGLLCWGDEWLQGHHGPWFKKGCPSAPTFWEYLSTIFIAEQVLIYGLPIIWRLSCQRVPPLV